LSTAARLIASLILLYPSRCDDWHYLLKESDGAEAPPLSSAYAARLLTAT